MSVYNSLRRYEGECSDVACTNEGNHEEMVLLQPMHELDGDWLEICHADPQGL